eukprot:SAG22_NODE_17629_length_301_cov_1.158416_1_plen_53_part_10
MDVGVPEDRLFALNVDRRTVGVVTVSQPAGPAPAAPAAACAPSRGGGLFLNVA